MIDGSCRGQYTIAVREWPARPPGAPAVTWHVTASSAGRHLLVGCASLSLFHLISLPEHETVP